MTVIMLIHVISGTLSVCAGALALGAAKGKTWHIRAGKLYLISMLIMAFAGAIAALMLPQAINVFAAGLTGYLVITAWHAANKKQLGRGPFESISCAFICTIAFFCLRTGFTAMNSANGAFHGYAYDAYFIIGGMAAFAALMDLILLLRGKLSGKARMVRHIWRMCLSYFIAVGSLFEGPGASVFPKALRDSGLLSLPSLLVVLLMLYWLIRTLYPGLRVRFGRNQPQQ